MLGGRPHRPVHRRAVARRRAAARPSTVDDPSTGEMLAEVADATRRGRHGRRWTPRSPRRPPGPRPRRASAGEILRRAFELITARADDLALLMTLEMGKPLAESRGEIAYGAEFFRWFSEEAVRISGRYSVAPNGGTRLLTHEAAGRPVPDDHAVELPAGDGHPQDRPGDRRRLHDGGQAGHARRR